MWGGCWGRCGDADACVLFIFDLLIRAADQKKSPRDDARCERVLDKPKKAAQYNYSNNSLTLEVNSTHLAYPIWRNNASVAWWVGGGGAALRALLREFGQS